MSVAFAGIMLMRMLGKDGHGIVNNSTEEEILLKFLFEWIVSIAYFFTCYRGGWICTWDVMLVRMRYREPSYADNFDYLVGPLFGFIGYWFGRFNMFRLSLFFDEKEKFFMERFILRNHDHFPPHALQNFRRG